jgi:UDP-2,3-diacylglucosamine pyrophosphatase LpxH
MGSKVARAQECRRLIESLKDKNNGYTIRRLILLGDVFDSLNPYWLNPEEWNFLGTLRQICSPDSGVEVIWIRGNHDLEILKVIPIITGSPAYEQYQWQIGDKKYFAIHGDQFDKWVAKKYMLINQLPDAVYIGLQKIDGRKHHLSRFLKEKSKVFLHLNEKISAGTLKYLKDNQIKVDAFFCGHTHIPVKHYFESDKIWYYNTGCWTGEESPTYITITEDNEIETHHYHSSIK